MSDPYCSVCGTYRAFPQDLTTIDGDPVCREGLCGIAARGDGEELRLGIFGSPEEIAAYRNQTH